MSQTMPLQRHRAAAHTWQLARAIGMCPGTVTLVANRTGLSDGREPYPSTLFQHLRRQLGEPPVKQWRQVPERDEAALDETEQALARYRDPGYEQEVEGQFPWLGTGARAMRARAHKGTTRFDGWLGPRRRPELAIHTGAENVMSAAKLETLAKCPRQYFLRYVLGARPPEEVEDDPARWLQPLEMGQLLHELYCEFMSQLLARGERVDDEDSDHEQLLFALLDQQIALFERRIPVLYRAAYRADGASASALCAHLPQRGGRPCKTIPDDCPERFRGRVQARVGRIVGARPLLAARANRPHRHGGRRGGASRSTRSGTTKPDLRIASRAATCCRVDRACSGSFTPMRWRSARG